MIVSIENLSHEGKGIARVNNKVTFVKDSLIGEVVDIDIIKEYKSYNEAIVKKYINISNKRVKPLCKYYGICGGCNIMHINYNDQLEFKKNKVKNILYKYSNIDIDIDIVPSNKVFNYRNKVTLHIDKSNIGYMKENSNDIVSIDKCLLLDDKINNVIDSIKFNNKYNNYVIRCNDSDVISNDIDNYLIMNINDYKFRIDIRSFFQVNTYICGLIFNELLSNIDSNSNILDLYSGVGTLSIVTSSISNKVIGIEVNKSSYMNALENLKLNNISNTSFICGRVEDVINNIDFIPDIIITDPPRSGMDKVTINTIKKLLPNKIIYISCEVITLARDIKLLSEYYNVSKVKCFDMFPNTYHVESVCVLERRK